MEVLVAGVVFEEEDFVKPWQGLTSSLERYVVCSNFCIVNRNQDLISRAAPCISCLCLLLKNCAISAS